MASDVAPLQTTADGPRPQADGTPADAPDPWAKAFETLTAEERSQFEDPGCGRLAILKSIHRETETYKKLCKNRGWAVYKNKKGEEVKLRDILDKSSAWVNQIEGLIEKGLAFDTSGYSAAPWAAVKFLITVTFNDVRVFSKVAEAIESVSGVIVRCTFYEANYLGDGEAFQVTPQLRESITQLYAATLRYLAKAKSYFSGSSWGRLGKGLLDWLSGSFDKLQADISEVDIAKYAGLADSEVLRRVERGQATVLKSTLSQYEELKDALKSLEDPVLRVKDDTAAVLDAVNEQKRKDVFKWISTIQYREHHRALSKELLPDSGEWLFESHEFTEWERSDKSSIFWLHGVGGTGKTKLVSSIINTNIEVNPCQLAYFYCLSSPAEPERGNPVEIMRALLRQLTSTDGDLPLPKPVADVYDARKKMASRDGSEPMELDLEDCAGLILELTKETPAMIIVDALDECVDPYYMLARTLVKIASKSEKRAKIFVSSRYDSNLQFHLKNPTSIAITADTNHADIARFIKTEVYRLGKLGLHPLLSGKRPEASRLRGKTIKALTDDAQGMFRWAAMSLERLRGIRQLDDYKKALGSLPPQLSDLYNVVYGQISCAEPTERNVVERTLRWLLYAQRQLTIKELIAAISVNSNGTAISWPGSAADSSGASDEVERESLCSGSDSDAGSLGDYSEQESDLSEHDEAEWSGQMSQPEFQLIQMCRSFVIIDSELGVFRLAHHSVREYLGGRAEFLASDAHALAANRCVDVYVGATKTGAVLQHNEVFRPYAALHWPVHCQMAGTENLTAALKAKVMEFLLNGSHISDTFRTWVEEVEPLGTYFIRQSQTPLLLVCSYGLLSILTDLEDSTDIDWNEMNNMKSTGLHLAALAGHTEVVKTLLDKGARVDQGNTYRGDTALHYASKAGHVDVAELLIAAKARVNSRTKYGWTPLHNAAWEGHCAMADKLLECGAGVNINDREGTPPLYLAVMRGNKRMVQLLVNAKAAVDVQVRTEMGSKFDFVTEDRYESPLFTAMHGGNGDIVDVLIKAGADVNARMRGRDLSALDEAVRRERTAVAQQLLRANADAATALHVAAGGLGRSAVQFLVEKAGVDIDAPANKDKSTALQLAAYGADNDEPVRLLLDAGAAINATDAMGWTALHCAAQNGHMKVMKVLIEAGAAPDLPDRNGVTALHLAAFNGNEALVRLILEVDGVHTEKKARDGNTAKDVARMRGYREIERLLENPAGSNKA